VSPFQGSGRRPSSRYKRTNRWRKKLLGQTGPGLITVPNLPAVVDADLSRAQDSGNDSSQNRRNAGHYQMMSDEELIKRLANPIAGMLRSEPRRVMSSSDPYVATRCGSRDFRLEVRGRQRGRNRNMSGSRARRKRTYLTASPTGHVTTGHGLSLRFA